MPNIRKPTALKALAGNAGKRKLNREEPRPSGLPVAPGSLSPDALPVWHRLVTSMPVGVFAATDEHLLAAYCEHVVLFQAATKALRKEPKIVMGSTGQPTVSPWVKILNEATTKIAQLGPQLGLTPVARQSLSVASETKAKNPFLN